MRNTKDAMQIVRFGKTADEPKTRYQQAQEDRLNENFRKMLDLLLAIVNTPLASTSEGPATVANGIHFAAVDPDSTSTKFTAQIPGITSYYDGLIVMLKNGVVTSASGFTINVNGLGAKPVYSNMAAASAETTIFNVNYTLIFVYDSKRVTGGCWVCYRGYDSNTNTIGYQLRTNSFSLPASDKFYRYRLLFASADNKKFVPANTSTSTNATASRATNQRPINPFGPIVYYGSTTVINADAKPGATALWQQYVLVLGYSFNNTGAALTLTNGPVYLRCTPQADGSAVMDYFTQQLPSTDDGKIYIFLGMAYDATHIELYVHHPVYCFKNGSLQLWRGSCPELPAYTSADEGKVCKIVNGAPAWATP